VGRGNVYTCDTYLTVKILNQKLSQQADSGDTLNWYIFLIHGNILIHAPPFFRENPFFSQGLVRNLSLFLLIKN